MKRNSIKKNAVLNTMFSASNVFFTLLTYPYITRVLLVEGTGKVSFFSAISSYAIMLSALGIGTYGIRATAIVRDDRKKLSEVTGQLFLLNLLMTLLVIACLIASIPFVGRFQNDVPLLLINCSYVLSEAIGMPWLFSGLEQYDYVVKRTLAFRTLSLVLVFLFVKEPGDYNKYAAICAFSNIAAYSLNYVYSKKFVSFRLVKSWDFRTHLRPMLFLFASTFAMNVYTNLDTVMLGFVSGDTETGYYTLAVKIKSVLVIVINSISAVLLPRLSYYIEQNELEEFQRVLKKSISVILMISIPMAVFFACEADDSIQLLGGEGYLPAVTCMRIIMPILIISSFSNIMGNQVLIPLKRDGCYMKAVVIGAITDLLLNAVLMPRWGCNGAAVATLIAEMVQMLLQLYFARDYIFGSIQIKSIFKISIAAVCSGVMISVLHVIVFQGIVVRLFLSMILYGFCYCIGLLILREKAFRNLLGAFLGGRKTDEV